MAGRNVFAPSRAHFGLSVVIGVTTLAVGLLGLLFKAEWWRGCETTPIGGPEDSPTWQCVGVETLKLTGSLTIAHAASVLLSACVELLVMSSGTGNQQHSHTILTNLAHIVCAAVLIVVTWAEALCVHDFSQCVAGELHFTRWQQSVVVVSRDHGLLGIADGGVNFANCAVRELGRPAHLWMAAIGYEATNRYIRTAQPRVDVWFCDSRYSWPACLSRAIDTNVSLSNCVVCYYAVLVVLQLYFASRTALICATVLSNKGDTEHNIETDSKDNMSVVTI